MKTIAITILFLSACGKENNHNFFIDTNGFPVSEDLIYQEVFLVENYYNQIFNDNIDLMAMMQDNGLGIRYVDTLDVRGRYNPNNMMIYMHYSDPTLNNDPTWNETEIATAHCIDNYYVLGHELLHFIADKHMGIDGGHDIEKLFLQWAVDNHTNLDTTVEYYLFTDTRDDICN